MDDARLGALRAAKLAALVRARAPQHDGTPADFAGGAALVDRAAGTAWLLLSTDRPVAALGPALVWAARQGAAAVHLVVDDGDEAQAAVLARRAGCFTGAPEVWRVVGTELAPVAPAAAPVPVAAPSAPALAELLVDADLEVVVEDGIVRGEVAGLEVARVVHGTTTAGVPIDEPVLEVGVGHADRELTAMLHGGLAPVDQLARVIEIVRAHRRPGAERHPLNQLAPERWLRSRLLAHPERVGCTSLRPVAGAVARPNLRDRAVAHAVGTRPDGTEVLVAASVGVDLDVVPDGADARLVHAPDATLVVAVPERDAHPVTTALLERLARPAELVALPGDWRD